MRRDQEEVEGQNPSRGSGLLKRRDVVDTDVREGLHVHVAGAP